MDLKTVIENAKKEIRNEKEKISFRLRSDLIAAFKKRCEREKVSQTLVLEELLKSFLE